MIGENERWELWLLNRKAANWFNMKLICKKRRMHKANFRLSWSLKDKRFSYTREAFILIENDIEAFLWARDMCLPLTQGVV